MVFLGLGEMYAKNEREEEISSEYEKVSVPVGLRVLLVDDDLPSLMILEKMFKNCRYQVTKCQKAKDALDMLRQDKSSFDLVVSDVHMPDMDGFELLEHIRLEMDLPVVLISSDDDEEVFLKGILHGACSYLIKPIRMDAVKFMWEHVIRKKTMALKQMKQTTRAGEEKSSGEPDDAMAAPGSRCNNSKSLRRRRDDRDEMEDALDDKNRSGKKRMVWTKELHEKFVAAVNILGPENAVPLKILEVLQQMNATGVTRENIASHLQKYRMQQRKKDDFPPQECHHFAHSCMSGMSTFQQFPSPGFNEYGIQLSATPRQYPLRTLTTQASASATLGANSSLGTLLNDHCDILRPNPTPQSCYCPVTPTSVQEFALNSSSSVLDSSLTNVSSVGISSFGDEYDFTAPRNIAEKPRDLSFRDPFDIKHDTKPLRMLDPSVYFQHFDDDDMLNGPLMEPDVVPFLVEHSSNYQLGN